MTKNLEENIGIFKSWVKEYGSALKIKEVYDNDEDNQSGIFAFMKEFKGFLYNSIHRYLTPNKKSEDYEKTIRVYCKYIKEKIIPVCRKKIKMYANSKEENAYLYLNKWLDLEDDFFALASYRDLKLFALYLERGKTNKLWAKTIHLFENFFEYAQRMVFGEKIKLIRASYFPGAGKTYAGNILCAFWFGYDSEMSILRITYSDDLCSTFIQQIGNIIGSKQYRKVFPQFDKGEGSCNQNKALYTKFSTDLGFQFSFSSVFNFYASTRYGQITGKRGNVLMIDDLIKGVTEAYDEKINKDMENKYDLEWTTRPDNSYQPVIALGTMWSNLDLLNVLYNRALKDTRFPIGDDPKYKYTKLSSAKLGEKETIKAVFIATPILDYTTDLSTCPLRYETDEVRERRDNMDEYFWNAVYQQQPCPPEDFVLAYNNLQTYNMETYPTREFKEKETETYAFIDPTRRGTDFFAMGIFKRYKVDNRNWSKWYLIDCLFEQAPTNQMYYEVATKIVHHNIRKLGFENNIDMSFEEVIKHKLKELRYTGTLDIEPFFSSKESKQTKILIASTGMKKEIVYPAPNVYANRSPMGLAMNQLTNWNLSQKYGDHDDFPDMVAMFVKYFCETVQNNSFVVLNRKQYGLY